jgi:hypothetical protein
MRLKVFYTMSLKVFFCLCFRPKLVGIHLSTDRLSIIETVSLWADFNSLLSESEHMLGRRRASTMLTPVVMVTPGCQGRETLASRRMVLFYDFR